MADNDRTDQLLAMVLMALMKDASMKERAIALARANFTPAEIAEFLGTSSASVSQQLYEARRGKKPKRQHA
jgi:DNA-directed RNA polymerase specialized sigma24 family protein